MTSGTPFVGELDGVAVADQNRSAAGVEIMLGQGERLVDAQLRPPEQHDRRMKCVAAHARRSLGPMGMFALLRRLLRRLSSAHVISLLALFLALGGGAYAAIKIGPENIERNAVRSRHIKDGTISRQDLNRDLRLALARHGATGAPGPTGPTGTAGSEGPQGPAGPFPDALPAGRTLGGTFAISGTAAAAVDTAQTAESFAFALAEAPAVHVIAAGLTPPAECPGSPAAPAAGAGHLCVFEVERSAAVASLAVFDPSASTGNGAGKATRFGFGIRATADAGGALRSAGTWAVTGG